MSTQFKPFSYNFSKKIYTQHSLFSLRFSKIFQFDIENFLTMSEIWQVF